MADVIQLDYQQLEEIAGRFAIQADEVAAMNGRLQRQATALQTSWSGSAADRFFLEWEDEVWPAADRLTEALAEAAAVTREIVTIFAAAEEEAASQLPFFEERATPGATDDMREAGDGDWWDPIRNIVAGIVEAADGIDDFLPIPAALLLATMLRPGSTYAGQILVKGPRWLKDLAGLSPSLTHIKATNMAQHIGKFARKLPLLGGVIALGKSVVAIGDVWTNNWEEYGGYAPSKRVTAMGVDAILASLPAVGELGGGVVGAVGGAKAGAALGTLIAPGLGTAVGAVIGGALFGFAGDWLGGRLGEAARDGIIESGGRDRAITLIDDHIAQPVARGISEVATAVADFELPTLRLPQVNFSF